MSDDYADDLDAYMAGLDEAPPADEPPPVPRDADEANRLLRRLDRFKTETARIHAAADAEFARIQGWRDDRLSGLDRQIGFHEKSLESWMRAQFRERPQTKTYRLPSGEVKVRAGRQRIVISDHPDTVATVKAEHPDWVQTVDQIAKTEVDIRPGLPMSVDDALTHGFDAAPEGHVLCWAVAPDGVASTSVAVLVADPEHPQFNYTTKES